MSAHHFQQIGPGVGSVLEWGPGACLSLEGEKEVGSVAMQRHVDAVQRLVFVSLEASQPECITGRTWHMLVFDVLSCFSEIQI